MYQSQRLCLHKVSDQVDCAFTLALSWLSGREHGPSCAELRFTCWMGAYPGLTNHFSKANLDPKANQWDKVSSCPT